MSTFIGHVYEFKVKKINRILDGDTIDATLDVGFGMSYKAKFRMSGYTAPSTWRPISEEENKAGIEVTKYLEELINKYKDKDRLFVRSHKLGIYGRYSAELLAKQEDGSFVSINDMVKEFIDDNNYSVDRFQ